MDHPRPALCRERRIGFPSVFRVAGVQWEPNEETPMTFLLLTIFAQAGAGPQESSMPAEKLEALLFECRVGGTVDPKEKAVEALSKVGDDSLPVLIRALAGKYPER